MRPFFLLLLTLVLSLNAQASEVSKIHQDIKAHLGLVPTFLKEFPEAGLEGAWEDMKNLQLNSKTHLPAKYKALIGLAVSAQIPCQHCVYFNRQSALTHGASEQEMKEAIALAASVRRWSTYLNGIQADEAEFRREVDQLMSIQLKNKNRQAMEEKPVTLKTAQDAYTDITNTLGFVPTYIKNYPPHGIVGVWKEMKGVELNPASAIPAKYKDLIGLAVASQVPCSYCTYYHTETALFSGAGKEELQEAVALAGIIRQWSTVSNGLNIDEQKFQEETRQIMKFLKEKSQKSMTVKN